MTVYGSGVGRAGAGRGKGGKDSELNITFAELTWREARPPH